MPRFHLNIRSNGSLLPDQEGYSFLDLDAARREAVLACREILSNAARQGRGSEQGVGIEITDETGALVGMVLFSRALDDGGRSGADASAAPRFPARADPIAPYRDDRVEA